jgi:hypothetical protein
MSIERLQSRSPEAAQDEAPQRTKNHGMEQHPDMLRRLSSSSSAAEIATISYDTHDPDEPTTVASTIRCIVHDPFVVEPDETMMMKRSMKELPALSPEATALHPLRASSHDEETHVLQPESPVSHPPPCRLHVRNTAIACFEALAMHECKRPCDHSRAMPAHTVVPDVHVNVSSLNAHDENVVSDNTRHVNEEDTVQLPVLFQSSSRGQPCHEWTTTTTITADVVQEGTDTTHDDSHRRHWHDRGLIPALMSQDTRWRTTQRHRSRAKSPRSFMKGHFPTDDPATWSPSRIRISKTAKAKQRVLDARIRKAMGIHEASPPVVVNHDNHRALIRQSSLPTHMTPRRNSMIPSSSSLSLSID